MKDMGFTTKVWFGKCKLMGFESRSEFVHCQRMNCLTKAEFDTFKKSPEYEELTSMGFTTKADYDDYKRMSRAVSNKSWGNPLNGKEAHDVLNFKSRAEFDDYRHLGNVKSQADVQTFGQGDYVKMKELGFTTKEEFNTLAEKYKTNDPEYFVSYKDFCASINKAFTVYGIQ